jgi:S-adenosylmethionine synthetase
VDTQGTARIPEPRIAELVRKHFDFRPGLIIRQLDLLHRKFEDTASYGHFGRTGPNFTWERTDRAEALKADAF